MKGRYLQALLIALLCLVLSLTNIRANSDNDEADVTSAGVASTGDVKGGSVSDASIPEEEQEIQERLERKKKRESTRGTSSASRTPRSPNTFSFKDVNDRRSTFQFSFSYPRNLLNTNTIHKLNTNTTHKYTHIGHGYARYTAHGWTGIHMRAS